MSPYDPEWGQAFEQIRELVLEALGDRALAIEHVGSTSVPGLAAKPVIDVVLLTPDSSREDDYVKDLESAGFDLLVREPDWFEHRLLKLHSPEANLHVFSAGCTEADRMVAFRDLLRRDFRAREVYASRKRDLAQTEWSTVQEYADAKAEIVQRLLSGFGDVNR